MKKVNIKEKVKYNKELERWTIDITDYAKEIFGDIVTEGIIVCNHLSDRCDAEIDATLFFDEANKYLSEKRLELAFNDIDITDFLFTFVNGKKVEMYLSNEGTFVKEFNPADLKAETEEV